MGRVSRWLKAGEIYTDKRMVTMVFLGFSSGFPLLLVLGTLSLWLMDFGLSYATIGAFSLVKLPYSFKWLWAPIIDRVKLPFFGRMGRRRGWAIVTQLILFGSLLGMASINPAEKPLVLAVFALVVAFASASQDIVLDAYRVESFKDKEQGAGTAMFVLGYRFGVLFSGAVALLLASSISWNIVYLIMSTGAVVGMLTILCSPEPIDEEDIKQAKLRGDLRHRVQSFIRNAVILSFADFMKRSNWVFILVFIFLYKMSDAYIGPMAFPFYQDIGFSKIEIATISKIYGMIATVGGSIAGGLIVSRFGIFKALFICGVFQCISNLMFVVQAYAGHNTYMLIATISIENISGGMATTAFVAYLSSLCNVLYTATQYALLSSLMSLARDIVAATSGQAVEILSWGPFFAVTTVLGIPGLLMIPYLAKSSKVRSSSSGAGCKPSR